MRYYHIVWLLRVGLLFLFVGFVLMGLQIFEIIPDFGTVWNKVSMGFILAGVLLNFGLQTWLSFKNPSSRGPNSAHAQPVEAKGVWVDSFTSLQVGTRVLACSYGQWYRGHIVKVKSAERYVVRFLGWDPFWDEIHHRSDLQLDGDDEPNQDEPATPQTSIRE